MSTKPYDQAFKYLAEEDAQGLLVLLGHLRPDEPARVELLPRELSVAALLPDQPYLVERPEGASIAHIEAQTAYERNIPAREVEYEVRLWLTYRLPVFSYVLLLTRRGLPTDAPQEQVVDAGDLRIVARYRLVRLWEIPAQEALAMGRAGLLPFVPLMRGEEAELEAGARRLRDVQDMGTRMTLGLHFLLLGGLRYNRDELLELIGEASMIPLEILKESDFYKFMVEEALKEGHEKGRAEGRAEGLAEALLDVIEKRFPGLNVAARISQIRDEAALRQLLAEVASAPDAATFEKRLAEILQL